MPASPNRRFKTFGSFPRGCHGALAPTDLADGYFHRGVNVSVRDGQVSTRPRFKKEFTLGGTGAFNGSFVYSLDDGDRLVYGRGGKVRILDLWSGDDREVGTLNDTALFFCQAERYCIVQDGTSRPLILHESALLRQAANYANPAPADGNEVYTGTIMAYGHGRIFMVPTFLHNTDGVPTAETGKPYWVAGSIFVTGEPESLLKFGESQYLAGGVAASLPFESGFIQGLAFFQNVASGTGLGPLLVFGRRGVTAVSVNVPRDAWLSSDFSQVLFVGPGTTSPRSITSVNNDLLYRALDGIRSVRLTTGAAQGQDQAPLAVVPISFEVNHRLKLDTSADLPWVTGSFADNRVLMPVNGDGAGTFSGLLSMDTAPTSSMGQAYPPAFDDLWTGLSFRQVHSGRIGTNDLPEHLVVTADSVYSLSETETQDNASTAPTCRLYLPATLGDGRSNPEDLVRFLAAHLTFRQVKGPLTVKAWYRADEYPKWAETGTYTWEGDGSTEISLARVSLTPLSEQGSMLGQGLVPGYGRTVQLCIEWTGVATLVGSVLEMDARPLDPEVAMACNLPGATLENPPESGAFQSLDDFVYSAES